MYKIPDGFDFLPLVGCEVQQICFSFNTIDIFLKKDHNINITGLLELGFDNNFIEIDAYNPGSDKGLLKLLEKKITAVVVNPERDQVLISLEQSFTLNLIGDPNYESFTIQIGNQEILI